MTPLTVNTEVLSPSAVDAYLRRIAYTGPRAPTAAVLCALQRAHLLAVPFENLDIGLGRPISLDLAALHAKIVTRRRGGFCYELNGLFAALLHALGFPVTLLSARVFNDGGLGPEFDHLALLVTLEQRWLADVGFGDFSLAPLRFEDPGAQGVDARGYAYRLLPDGDGWRVDERHGPGAAWEAGYHFALQPRAMADFAPMCVHHQTSPQSHFTQRRVCSLATPEGRVTLSELRFITTTGPERAEQALAGEAEREAVLRRVFGVDLAA
jgi:N-hydroxyarylamine O-acetyltransferase